MYTSISPTLLINTNKLKLYKKVSKIYTANTKTLL